jgi:hypothetical protein
MLKQSASSQGYTRVLLLVSEKKKFLWGKLERNSLCVCKAIEMLQWKLKRKGV